MSTAAAAPSDPAAGSRMKLFWACFIALVATSFIFGVRANIIGDLQAKFNLSESQKGNINGVGMWPFALSIIVFSLIIDRIGYKTAALIAIGCHVVSLILTVMATGYESLYWSTALVAIANGVVESFINPVVATAFSRQKAKWLNILHAGWPAGLALGALFTVILKDMSWEWKFGACFIPVVIYGALILPQKFPANERVLAGVSYRDMLREVGAVGFFAIGALVTAAVAQLAGTEASLPLTLGVGAAVGIAAGLYTHSPGNWLFLLVLLTMGPLATTELGTDGWMPELLKFAKPDSPLFATWVFIYVSTIMTILRFYAGPIVHRFSPIGLLVIGGAISIAGLLFLWQASGWMVVVAAATVYAFGKTFLWSTTLGMTTEQFPKGGALTLNAVSAVGVLGLGVVGSPFIGYHQDQEMDRRLRDSQPAIHAMVNGPEKPTIFGKSPSLDVEKIKALSKEQTAELEKVQAISKQATFAQIAMLPGIMLVCYLAMFLWFKSRGGYKPVEIGGGAH
jgi:DHA2 family metal-tetracycline-proton antiporter-like MFS transporter